MCVFRHVRTFGEPTFNEPTFGEPTFNDEKLQKGRDRDRDRRDRENQTLEQAYDAALVNPESIGLDAAGF